jgi:putative restriction endonuclease
MVNGGLTTAAPATTRCLAYRANVGDVADLADYLQPSVSHARDQFRQLLTRRPIQAGRQVTFLPVETLLCLAASFVVNRRQFGGANVHNVPEPVPSLARLFCRSPTSVLAKMANLDGAYSHGGK